MICAGSRSSFLGQGLEIGKVLGVLGRCKSHAVSLSAGTLNARIDGVFDPVVALFFQLVGQLRAARPYDPSVE